VGHVEDELSLVISIKILWTEVLDSFWVLVAKFTVWDKLHVVNELVFSGF
jgi:hypothetical protein